MKIVVTGGSGMVGRCIKNLEFLWPKHTFIYLNRSKNDEFSLDLTDRTAVLEYFKTHKYDFIIHLAANVGGLYKNMEKNIDMFSSNIKINENVLEAANASGINRGAFILSSCIYPANPSKFPMDETMIHESPPHPSNEGYAYAKRMLEVQCRKYNETYNRQYICLIPVNLYGPYDYYNLNDSHLIPGLMHRLHLCKLTGNAFTAYGSGKPLRQLLYAPDFAYIILKVLLENRYTETSPLICCNNEEYSIKDIVSNVCNVMNIPFDKIEWNTNKSDGCLKKTVSNKKLSKIFPELTFTNLHDGLTFSYKWFVENYDSVRK